MRGLIEFLLLFLVSADLVCWVWVAWVVWVVRVGWVVRPVRPWHTPMTGVVLRATPWVLRLTEFDGHVLDHSHGVRRPRFVGWSIGAESSLCRYVCMIVMNDRIKEMATM